MDRVILTPKEFFDTLDKATEVTSINDKINEYVQKVKKYDWYYEMSDSGEVFRRGQAYDTMLHKFETEMLVLGITKQKIDELWNDNCHKDFLRPINKRD